MTKRKAKFTDPLAYRLNFTPEDLAANQDGQVTKRQQRQLRWRQLRATLKSASAGCIGYVVLVAVIGQPLLGVILSTSDGDDEIQWLLIGIGIVLFFAILIFLSAILRNQDYSKDMKNELHTVDGRVQLDIQRKRSNKYFISIQDETFEVRKNEFLAFKNGDPYAIYYTPLTRVILSAEWLGENPFN